MESLHIIIQPIPRLGKLHVERQMSYFDWFNINRMLAIITTHKLQTATSLYLHSNIESKVIFNVAKVIQKFKFPF